MTGPVRPTGILQPQRVQPEMQPPQQSPMAGQPGQPDMQQLLALLMMLLQGGGMGQGQPPVDPMMGQAPPAPMPQPSPSPMGAALMGGMGGP